jgi:hypothetical protein
MSSAQAYEEAALARAESLRAQAAEKDNAINLSKTESDASGATLSPVTSNNANSSRRSSVSDYHESLFAHTNAQYVRSKERLAKQNSRRGRTAVQQAA